MARHTAIVEIKAKGRDKGKHFLITEMSAKRAEGWAFRCLLALINNNVKIPDNFSTTGMAGLAQVGLQGLTGLPYLVAEPLLEEMMETVQIIPDFPKHNIPRELNEDAGDIEEVATLFRLRLEIFKLHTDFSEAAIQSLIERVKGIAATKKDATTSTELQK